MFYYNCFCLYPLPFICDHIYPDYEASDSSYSLDSPLPFIYLLILQYIIRYIYLPVTLSVYLTKVGKISILQLRYRYTLRILSLLI